MSGVRTAHFRFGPVRQDVGEKHVRVGDLVEAINVRQTKRAGVYTKRRGFARTAPTFVGGSLSGSPVSVVPGEGGVLYMRDSGDQLWSWSPSDSTWNYQAKHLRPWAEASSVASMPLGGYAVPTQPTACLVGSNLWTFALSTLNTYQLTIVNANTGAQVVSPITIAATGILQHSAVYDGTNVWLFWVASSGSTVKAHKFSVASPTTAPTATTYYTMAGGISALTLQSVQARYWSALGKVLVVFAGATSALRGCVHSYLDPATGTAATSQVSISVTGSSGDAKLGGIYILDGQDGSGTYGYYSIAGRIDSGANFQTGLVKFSIATISTYTVYSLNSPGTAIETGKVSSTAGFVDVANAQCFVITSRLDATATNRWGATSDPVIASDLYRFIIGTSAASMASAATSLSYSWVASGFISMGGRWYFLTGFDDVGFAGLTTFGSEAKSVQRCYHMREFGIGANVDACTTDIVSQVAVGQAGAAWHRPLLATSVTSSVATKTAHLFATSGTKFVCVALLAQPGSAITTVPSINVGMLSVDTAKVYGRPTQAVGRAICPGPIPIAWNAANRPHELAPLLNPAFVYTYGAPGATIGTTFAVVYTITDSDGTVWRSAPFTKSLTIYETTMFRIPNPFFKWGSTSLRMEIYMANGGALALQMTLSPEPSLPYTEFTTSAVAEGEALYTSGGALSAAWPVPCQAVASWRNRVFLAARNRIWSSKEIEPGFGPLWNEVMISEWSDESGDITAMDPVDWNYLAIFSATKPGAISGAGPDGRGNGNFTVMTLSARMGVLPGGIAQQGPGGCYWQDNNTGRIAVVTKSLETAEAAGGAYEYAGDLITASAWHDEESLLVFWSSSAKAAIVIDYLHTNEAATFGQCERWTFTTLAAVCSVVDDIGLCAIDAAGALYRPGAIWKDEKAGGSDLYASKLTTAPLQFGDLQGELEISKVQVLASARSACGIRLTTIPNYAPAGDARRKTKDFAVSAPAVAGEAVNASTRPAACARVQALAITVEDAEAIDAEGVEFEGVGVEFTVTGRLLQPSVGKAK
jgi:hypothetical protein